MSSVQVETGPAYIVQFRRQAAGRGGLSKISTLPHAQIWGPTPDFKILFCGYAEGLQIPKIWRKNLGPLSRYEFSKFVMGQKIRIDASWSRLGMCQVLSESVEEKVLLRPVYLCVPQWSESMSILYISS